MGIDLPRLRCSSKPVRSRSVVSRIDIRRLLRSRLHQGSPGPGLLFAESRAFSSIRLCRSADLEITSG